MERKKKEYVENKPYRFLWKYAREGYVWKETRRPTGEIPQLMLTPLPGGERSYKPLEEKGALFTEFTQVLPTMDQIRTFAHQYGLLTHGAPLLSDEATNITPGEPLYLWQSEIWEMEKTFSLWEAMENKDRPMLSTMISPSEKGFAEYIFINLPPKALQRFSSANEIYSAISEPSTLKIFVHMLPPDVPLKVSLGYIELPLDEEERDVLFDENTYSFSMYDSFTDLSCQGEIMNYSFQSDSGDFFAFARLYLQTLINQKLDNNCFPRLIHKEDRLVPYFFPRTLLAAMWLQFYLTVLGEKHIKRCRICGRWEDVTEKTSAWTMHKECSERKRMKEYRDRLKQIKRLYQEGMSVEEIASLFGKTPEWVQKKVKEVKIP